MGSGASGPTFAVSAVGRDRPGIVARTAAVLLEHGLNVEDSQMTILRGHFAMMLVVSPAGEAPDESALRADLDAAGRELGLDAIALSALEDPGGSGEPGPTHVVTVYGVDHPGIVHAVTTAAAERQVNVTDLSTRVIGESGYALLMEVALPPGLDEEGLRGLLEPVGAEQGVEVSVRELEQDAL